MPPSPNLFLVAISLLGIALAGVVILLGLILTRLRTLPMDKTARLVDDLSPHQDALEALLARFESEPDLSGRTAPATEATPAGPRATPAATPRPGPSRRADVAVPSAVAGPTLIAVPSLSAPAPGAARAVAAELGRRFGAIWELADSGASAEAIAKRTGQPIGQVELILALRRQLVAGPRGRA
jgi:hypothetical protein